MFQSFRSDQNQSQVYSYIVIVFFVSLSFVYKRFWDVETRTSETIIIELNVDVGHRQHQIKYEIQIDLQKYSLAKRFGLIWFDVCSYEIESKSKFDDPISHLSSLSNLILSYLSLFLSLLHSIQFSNPIQWERGEAEE